MLPPPTQKLRGGSILVNFDKLLRYYQILCYNKNIKFSYINTKSSGRDASTLVRVYGHTDIIVCTSRLFVCNIKKSESEKIIMKKRKSILLALTAVVCSASVLVSCGTKITDENVETPHKPKDEIITEEPLNTEILDENVDKHHISEGEELPKPAVSAEPIDFSDYAYAEYPTFNLAEYVQLKKSILGSVVLKIKPVSEPITDASVLARALEELSVTELTKGVVQEKTDCDSVSEYKEFIRKTLQSEHDAYKINAAKQNLAEQLPDFVEVTGLPDELVEWHVYNSMQSYRLAAKCENMSLEAFIATQFDDSICTEKELEAHFRKTAYEPLSTSLILKTISFAEDVNIDDNMYNEYLANYSETFGLSQKDLETYYLPSNLLENMISDEVVKMLLTNAEIQIEETP